MRALYGEPLRGDGERAGFAVIAYGKFGGIELGYGSDLDLVFLHDCDALDADTVGGARTINNGVYYARLAQRLINRSEEHTSELQSLMRISYAVFCLKKKTNHQRTQMQHQ